MYKILYVLETWIEWLHNKWEEEASFVSIIKKYGNNIEICLLKLKNVFANLLVRTAIQMIVKNALVVKIIYIFKIKNVVYLVLQVILVTLNHEIALNVLLNVKSA